MPVRPLADPPALLLGCVLVGLLAGLLSLALTQAVYAAEDGFGRLRLHWMWWPLLGGLAVGAGGLVFPRALGVGYDVIGELLRTSVTLHVVLGVLLVKSLIWAVALGSGTSGGVLAPLLMMGCALGALEAHLLPGGGAGFWPLVSMGATLGGTMRSPLTGVVFALELTHDFDALLPLLVAVVVAHLVTVLTMPRSILTEKVARRGVHLSREYAVDPLEVLRVREAMRAVVTDRDRSSSACVPPGRAVAYPDETLRAVALRMAETGLKRLPVVESRAQPRLLGTIALVDLLEARARQLDAEQRRERVLRLRVGGPRRPGAHARRDVADTRPAGR